MAFAVSAALFAAPASAATLYEWHSNSQYSIETLLQQKYHYQFNQNEDLVIKDSGAGSHNGGYGLIDAGQIFHIGADFGSNNDWNHTVTFSGQPDFMVRGTDLKTSTTQQGGLAVIAVNGESAKLTGNVWFDASGYALVSASNIELSGPIGTFAPDTPPRDAPSLVIDPDKKVEKTILVFQNQNSNKGSFDITDISKDSRLENGGIYIDTQDSDITFNGAKLKSHEDIVVDLGNKNLTLTGSTKIYSGRDSNDRVYTEGSQKVLINKEGDSKVVMGGTSGIVTEQLMLTNGAEIFVEDGSTASIGSITAGTSGTTLTLGGSGFSVGSLNENSTTYAEGLINSAGNLSLNGGQYFFSASNKDLAATEDVGLRSATGMTISNGAVVEAIDGAHIFANPVAKASDTNSSLTVTGQGTSVSIGGRRVSQFSDSQKYYQAIFNTFGTDDKFDSFGAWSILGANYDTLITNGASVTLNAAGVLMSKYHQIHAYSGTEIHTKTEDNDTDPAAIHANMSISIDGLGSTYDGLLWVESGSGNIQMLGGRFDITPSRNRVGLISKEGSLKLVSIDNGTEELNGSMEISNKGQTDKGALYAKKDIFVHGDKNLSISNTVLKTDGTGSLSTIQLTSGGEITLNDAYITTVTINGNTNNLWKEDYKPESGVKLGNIKIFGATAQNYQQGAASTSFVESEVGAAINITNSKLYGNQVQIGNSVGGAETVTITGSEIFTNGDGFGTGYAYNIKAQGDLKITNSEVHYSDGNNGITNISSVKGGITLDKANINDNAYNESGRGVLSVFIGESIDSGATGTITLKNGSRLDDDNIRLGAGKETIEVINSIIHVDNGTDNSLMLKAQSLALSDHSSIGENENDGRDSSGTALTGAVSIDVPTITLKDNSFITSAGAVDIKSNSITMEADSDGKASWIKGQSVNIANNDRGDNKNLSITGGEIKTTGNEGNDINISSAGNLTLDEISSIDAGKGDVNISMGLGSTSSIDNTNITGQTISFDGIADKDNANKDLGVIKVTGSSNITAGSDATGNAFGGKININSGAHVWVSSGSSIEAKPTQSGETDADTGIDIAGGKLTIEGGATVTSGDDVNITQGGAVDFVGKDSSNPGKLVAGGSVNIGGDHATVGDDNQGGSINVGTGSDDNAVGVIVTGKDTEDKLTIGTGGKVNIASGSHLVVTTDGSTATTGTGSGLTITGSDNSGSNGATVNIAGGTLITDKITTDDNAKLEETMVVGSDSYLAIDNPFKDQTDTSADKELSFAIDQNAENIVLDISNGNLSKDEIKVVADALGDKNSLLVSGSAVDIDKEAMTQKEWADHFGLGSDNTSLVVADKGVITVNNQISQGGGSWLVGQGNGPVNITGGEDGTGVFITGSQDELDEGEKFEAVHDGNGNALGVHVDANNKVTIGSSGSYGGDLSAGIDAEKGAEIDFIGGEWNVGSITGNGDLIIEDKSEHASGTVVNVDGPLEANGWEMTGETTGLNTDGDAHFTGSGLLTGGASADIGGALTVDNNLTLKDNAQLTVAGDSTINKGLTVNQGTSYETTGGADLTVTGGDSNFAGTVSVSGDYSNNDGKTTVTGSTTIDGTANTVDLIVGDGNFTGSGTNGSFVAGTTNVGGQFTAHKDSSTTINGDFSVAEDSTIDAGAQVTVDGKASFTGGLHVTGNGVFENKSKEQGTTVGDHLILETGSSVIAGSSFELAGSDVTIGNSPNSTNNTLSGHISATDHINFGNATNEITFSGANAGTDAHHIQAGAGGLSYENGASHLFTKTDSDPEGGIVTGVVNVGVGSSLTMDANNYGDSTKANLVMNDSLKLSDSNAMVVVGDLPQDVNASGAGIYLGTNSYFDLNASQFNSGDPIVTVGDNETSGTIYLSEGTTININNWTLGTDGYLTVNFDVLGDSDKDILDFLNSDNALYNFWYEGDRLGMGLGSASASGADNKFADVVDAVLASNSENAMKQSLVTGVFSKSSGFMTQLADGSWVVNDLGNQRLQDVLGLPIAAGSFNVAYDAMSQMGNSLMSHMIEPVTSKSTAVWADVISTRNRADTLFGDSGYSADIYAGVLGADQWVTPDTLLGAAVTIGTADAQGEGASMRIDNDAKFYGIFGYAMHRLHENLVASFDVGYMNVENDIDTDVNYGGKGDTKVLTASARLDMTLYRSETLSVTPHFGIRYANFDIDTINQTATNDINVIETPIGVTVKGKTSYKGWTINPNVDVSVVPQMADRKAKIWNSGEAFEQDILDPALVNSTIGVTGHKGDWSYGVNYRFGVGGNDRQNHSFIGNIRYQF